VGGFKPTDIGFAFLGHLQQDLAGVLVGQRRGQAAALLDAVPHPGDYLEIVIAHVVKIHLG